MILELQVCVIEVKNIPKMNLLGKRDPYVILQLSSGGRRK
jgi:hypothetical protein